MYASISLLRPPIWCRSLLLLCATASSAWSVRATCTARRSPSTNGAPAENTFWCNLPSIPPSAWWSRSACISSACRARFCGVFCRFIPYVGALIAAVLPLVVAAAIDPGWSMAVWTLLFSGGAPLEVIEPIAYGHTTGLTPVSVVIATIFWTWLWGPIGLILATPLTLCLVVLPMCIVNLEITASRRLRTQR